MQMIIINRKTIWQTSTGRHIAKWHMNPSRGHKVFRVGKIDMGLVNKFHATLTVNNKIIMDRWFWTSNVHYRSGRTRSEWKGRDCRKHTHTHKPVRSHSNSNSNKHWKCWLRQPRHTHTHTQWKITRRRKMKFHIHNALSFIWDFMDWRQQRWPVVR